MSKKNPLDELIVDKIKEFEFRTDNTVDALTLLEALQMIKTKDSFMVYNNKRYFKLTFYKDNRSVKIKELKAKRKVKEND